MSASTVSRFVKVKRAEFYILHKLDAAMLSAYSAGRETSRERIEQISPMHTVHAIPATRVGSDN